MRGKHSFGASESAGVVLHAGVLGRGAGQLVADGCAPLQPHRVPERRAAAEPGHRSPVRLQGPQQLPGGFPLRKGHPFFSAPRGFHRPSAVRPRGGGGFKGARGRLFRPAKAGLRAQETLRLTAPPLLAWMELQLRGSPAADARRQGLLRFMDRGDRVQGPAGACLGRPRQGCTSGCAQETLRLTAPPLLAWMESQLRGSPGADARRQGLLRFMDAEEGAGALGFSIKPGATRGTDEQPGLERLQRGPGGDGRPAAPEPCAGVVEREKVLAPR